MLSGGGDPSAGRRSGPRWRPAVLTEAPAAKRLVAEAQAGHDLAVAERLDDPLLTAVDERQPHRRQHGALLERSRVAGSHRAERRAPPPAPDRFELDGSAADAMRAGGSFCISSTNGDGIAADDHRHRRRAPRDGDVEDAPLLLQVLGQAVRVLIDLAVVQHDHRPLLALDPVHRGEGDPVA